MATQQRRPARISRRAQRAEAADAAAAAAASSTAPIPDTLRAQNGGTTSQMQHRQTRPGTAASIASISTASTMRAQPMHNPADNFQRVDPGSPTGPRQQRARPAPSFDAPRLPPPAAAHDPFTNASPSSSPTRRAPRPRSQLTTNSTSHDSQTLPRDSSSSSSELLNYTAPTHGSIAATSPSRGRAGQQRGEYIPLIPPLHPTAHRRHHSSTSDIPDEDPDDDDEGDMEEDDEERQRENRAVDARLSSACAEFWARGAGVDGLSSETPGVAGRMGRAAEEERRKRAAEDERNAEEIMARLREVVGEKLEGERWRFEAGEGIAL